ncbi:unnamed protein product [Lepidochelys kempii]
MESEGAGCSRLPGAAGGRGPAGSEREPQQPGEEAPPEAESDWSFIDCEMEAVALRDLPTATIACNLDPRLFQDTLCRFCLRVSADCRSWTCMHPLRA